MFDFAEPNNKLSQPTTTTTTTHVHAQQQENRIEEMITDMLTSNFSQVYLFTLFFFIYESNVFDSLMGSRKIHIQVSG